MVTPPPQDARMLARRYHLQRLLGRGAMGAVWEADDTVLRRPVAVKEVVLPPGLSPEERAVSCERTLREARAIARLGHPNVVTLFDVLDEDSRPWVVMELVPSRSLADVIKEDGPIHPHRAATVGLAILSALEAAHAAGITHRDVKPGNILLGHDGRVKLTDFGIARAAGDTTITGTGLLVGSPSYLAPEIVRGQEAGPAGDLWGLGATLYAAVEGRAPFAGADAMDTLAKVVQDPPAPFARAGALIPALSVMLEKDPLRRATPVVARRLLLAVLRGGDSDGADGSLGPAAEPPAARPAARWARPAGEAADDRPTELPGLPGLAAAEAAARARLEAGRDGDRPWLSSVPPAPFLPSAGRPADPAAAPPAAGRAVPPPPAPPPPGTGPPGTGPPGGGPAGVDPAGAGRPGAGPARASQARASQAGGDPAGPGSTPGGADAAEVAEADAAADAGAAEPGRHGQLGEPGWAGDRTARPDGGPLPAPAGAARHRQVDGPAAAADRLLPYGPPVSPGADGDAQLPPGPAGEAAAAADVLPYGPPAGEPADAAPTGPDPQFPYGPRGWGGASAGGPAAVEEPSFPFGAHGWAGGSPDQVQAERPGPDHLEPGQPGPDHLGPDHLGPGQPGAGHPGPDHLGPGHPGAGQLGPGQLGPGQLGPGQLGPGQLGPGQLGPGQGAGPQSPDEEPTQLIETLDLDGFGGARRGDDGRRQRLITALLAVAGLVLLVVIGGILAAKAFLGSAPADRPNSTVQLPEPEPSGPPDAPAGFSRYRHAGGFSVAVPRGWEPEVKPRGVVDVREPDSSRFLRLIRTAGGSDPLAQLTGAEGAFEEGHQDYHRIRLENIDYRGYPTADWEFTYRNDGSTRRVLYRSFRVDGASYAIYLSAPAAQWTESRRFFDTAAGTFASG